jgi:hypothetical protein
VALLVVPVDVELEYVVDADMVRCIDHAEDEGHVLPLPHRVASVFVCVHMFHAIRE